MPIALFQWERGRYCKTYLRVRQKWIFAQDSKSISKGLKLGIEVVIVWIKIGVVFCLLTIIALVDITQKDFGSIRKKVFWWAIGIIPFVGWLVYLIFGFRKGKKPGKTA